MLAAALLCLIVGDLKGNLPTLVLPAKSTGEEIMMTNHPHQWGEKGLSPLTPGFKLCAPECHRLNVWLW